jgi:beta-N-acetylhexosaminidase
MDVQEHIGQLFMLGFMGTSVSADLADLMNEYRPGGLIVFKRNLESIEQIAALTNDLQKRSTSPLLLAIDQEGGRVSRLPTGFTVFPPCAVLGRCGTTELAYAAASATARELRAVGLNMNMAPVLDLNTNPNNPIIGDRAFSADPTQVCELGLAVMAGLHDNQIIACGKHFPGHGDTDVDSHLELPVVRASAERLRGRELRPFRHAVDNGLAAVMTAHVLYPSLDADFPATLSPAILTDLLRDELRFHGVILTDDLEMRAIIDHYGIEEATVLAVKAGADMLLICKERELEVAAMEGLSRAVRDGTISTARIDASLRRIAHLKARFISPYTPVDPMAAKQIVGCRAHRTLLDTIRRTGVQA